MAVFFSFAETVAADVVEFTNKASWQVAAGDYTTITFQGYSLGTIITEQYADLGVHFTDGIDQIWFSGNFLNDGAGLTGAFASTTLEFDQPMSSIAVDYPGAVRIRLYESGVLFHQSTFTFGGAGNFAGLISTQRFDSVILSDPQGDLFFDDLYFGPPIPAPGVLSLFAAVAIFARERRRAK